MSGTSIYLEAYSCGEWGDGPSYAKVDVTEAFAERLRTLRRVAEEHGLSEVRSFDSPEEWHNEEELRIVNCELCVCGDAFWFHAHPKHSDDAVETRAQDIEAFLAAVGNGERYFVEEGDRDELRDLVLSLEVV